MNEDLKPSEEIAIHFDIDIGEMERLASIGYSPENIAMYFNLPKADFLYHFYRENSPLMYHYKRGILVLQAEEGLEMQKAASKGNTTQGQRLDKLRYQINFEQQKKKLIYGDDEDDI